MTEEPLDFGGLVDASIAYLRAEGEGATKDLCVQAAIRAYLRAITLEPSHD